MPLTNKEEISFASNESLEEDLDQYDTLPEDTHVLHLWEPLAFKIDEDFEFVHHGFLFTILSSLLYLIAFPILFLLDKVMLDFSVDGIEKLHYMETGKITVSNHVHFLDCTMIGLANFPEKTYFTSLESNFRIPIVKQLITLLNTIPIPTNRKYLPSFAHSIDELLQNGNTIHFYPEASLWPYSRKLRSFKNGAFSFAVENQVPIVPCVFTFHNPTGIRSLFKKKPFVKMTILDPIYPNSDLSTGEAKIDLKEKVHDQMTQKIKEIYKS